MYLNDATILQNLKARHQARRRVAAVPPVFAKLVKQEDAIYTYTASASWHRSLKMSSTLTAVISGPIGGEPVSHSGGVGVSKNLDVATLI